MALIYLPKDIGILGSNVHTEAINTSVLTYVVTLILQWLAQKSATGAELVTHLSGFNATTLSNL